MGFSFHFQLMVLYLLVHILCIKDKSHGMTGLFTKIANIHKIISSKSCMTSSFEELRGKIIEIKLSGIKENIFKGEII